MNFHNEENREAHRTDEYEIQQLILRRGQAFDITVTFNRDYNPNDDVIVVQFVTGIQFFCYHISDTSFQGCFPISQKFRFEIPETLRVKRKSFFHNHTYILYFME